MIKFIKYTGESMDFKSSLFMYILGLGIALFVIAQSLFFLIRAEKRAKELGITKETIRKTISSSAVFTLAPSLAIVATVLTLSAALGLVLPWIRLTVIGNISYEVPAAQAAIEAFGSSAGLSQEITDPKIFASIAWVMTLGSVMPLVLVPFMLKKIEKGMGKVASKDSRWADLMSAAAFIGLISAFIGRAVAGKGDKLVIGDGAGVASLIALIFSMLFMFIFEKFAVKFNIKWLKTFAMPFAMILAMLVLVLCAKFIPPQILNFEWRG